MKRFLVLHLRLFEKSHGLSRLDCFAWHKSRGDSFDPISCGVRHGMGQLETLQGFLYPPNQGRKLAESTIQKTNKNGCLPSKRGVEGQFSSRKVLHRRLSSYRQNHRWQLESNPTSDDDKT